MKHTKSHGFTLMEVAVVVSMLSLLLGFVWINLLGSREKAGQATTVDIFVSDVKAAQLKAMLGDTEGRVTKDAYGVRFGSTSYTVFHGSTYTPADPTNRTNTLGDNEVFQSVTFPNSIIHFASVSGEIIGFSQGSNSLRLTNTSNQTQKTLQFNKYGAITSIQ